MIAALRVTLDSPSQMFDARSTLRCFHSMNLIKAYSDPAPMSRLSPSLRPC